MTVNYGMLFGGEGPASSVAGGFGQGIKLGGMQARADMARKQSETDELYQTDLFNLKEAHLNDPENPQKTMDLFLKISERNPKQAEAFMKSREYLQSAEAKSQIMRARSYTTPLASVAKKGTNEQFRAELQRTLEMSPEAAQFVDPIIRHFDQIGPESAKELFSQTLRSVDNETYNNVFGRERAEVEGIKSETEERKETIRLMPTETGIKQMNALANMMDAKSNSDKIASEIGELERERDALNDPDSIESLNREIDKKKKKYQIQYPFADSEVVKELDKKEKKDRDLYMLQNQKIVSIADKMVDENGRKLVDLGGAPKQAMQNISRFLQGQRNDDNTLTDEVLMDLKELGLNRMQLVRTPGTTTEREMAEFMSITPDATSSDEVIASWMVNKYKAAELSMALSHLRSEYAKKYGTSPSADKKHTFQYNGKTYTIGKDESLKNAQKKIINSAMGQPLSKLMKAYKKDGFSSVAGPSQQGTKPKPKIKVLSIQ